MLTSLWRSENEKLPVHKGALRRIPVAFQAVRVGWLGRQVKLPPQSTHFQKPVVMKNVARSFTMNGKRYFVPTSSMWAWRDLREGLDASSAGEKRWADLKRRIECHWQPHPAFKTFAKTGHVAALRPHVGKQWFAVIDLAEFYDHVTRTKVHRALEGVGFSRADAFRLAGESTIRQGGKHGLVRGFRQSSMLAALVLDQSFFGSRLLRHPYNSNVTIFSDDIVLSSDDLAEIELDFDDVVQSLKRSNFAVNPTKTQSPKSEVTVFNIHLSEGGLRFTDERMWRFLRQAIETLKGTRPQDRARLYRHLYGNYVASIDPTQARLLEASLGISVA